MSTFFNSYVDNEQQDSNIKLRMTETGREEEGGVEDMISPPHFGTLEKNNLPPTFADPHVAQSETRQKYKSLSGYNDKWYERNDVPVQEGYEQCYVRANSQDGLEADLENLAIDMKRHTYQINLGKKTIRISKNMSIQVIRRIRSD